MDEESRRDRTETRRIQLESRAWYEREYELPNYSWDDAPTAYRYHKGGLMEVVAHPAAYGDCQDPDACLYAGPHLCLSESGRWLDNLGAEEIYKYPGETLYEVGSEYYLVDDRYRTPTVFGGLAELLDYLSRNDDQAA